MSKTRIVRLRTGKLRDDAQNSQTVVLVPDSGNAAPPSFEELFICHYRAIRELCQGYGRRGVAIVAIDPRGVAARAVLAAKQSAINAGIVGRHGVADVFLDGDPTLSLRHMAVVLHPETGGADLRFRLLDLRTSVAFVDEHGQRLESLVAEGPVFVSCGRYALFLLPTADDDLWPDDGRDAWACIPERVYLHNHSAEPDRWRRRRRHAAGADAPLPGGRTRVQTFRGPARARRRLLREGEEPLGELVIRSGGGRTGILVGPAAAHEGVLLGRYDRCDTEGLPVLSHPSISRVHLLLVQVEGQLYAVDLASTNGLWRVSGDEVRIAPLTAGTELVLGNDLARLSWTAA